MKAIYNDRKVKKIGGLWHPTEYEDNYIEVDVLGKHLLKSYSGPSFYTYLIKLPHGKTNEVTDAYLFFPPEGARELE
jgi:hypothetical protein